MDKHHGPLRAQALARPDCYLLSRCIDEESLGLPWSLGAPGRAESPPETAQKEQGEGFRTPDEACSLTAHLWAPVTDFTEHH